MQQTLAKLKTKKKNGGFTLVELIIVIAIMAALVAILAPQYVKYVEKSRVSADDSTADQILNAVKVAASDSDLTWVDDSITVKWSAGSSDNLVVTASDSTNKSQLETALNDSFSLTGTNVFSSDKATISQLKSSTYKSETYTVTFSISSGTPTVSGKWG